MNWDCAYIGGRFWGVETGKSPLWIRVGKEGQTATRVGMGNGRDYSVIVANA